MASTSFLASTAHVSILESVEEAQTDMSLFCTVQFVVNAELSKVPVPDRADFVVRSVWNNTHT